MVETSTQQAAVRQQSWLGTFLLKGTKYNKYTVISRYDKFQELIVSTDCNCLNESSGVQASLGGFVFSVIITHCCSARQNVGIDLVATMNLKVHLNFMMKMLCSN